MMLWRFYQQIMVSHPLRTNCFTALGVMCIGDTTAQLINNEKQNIFEFEVDKPRLLTMLSWNSLCFTPFFFYFFRTVDAIFPGSGLRNVVLKVMTTQLSVTIPINVAAISYKTTVEMYLDSIFQKNTTSPFEMERVKNEIIERLDVDLFKLFCSSACFWTPINFVKFKFCPLQYRVIPTIVGGVIWNAYLSFTIHEKISTI